LLVLQLTHKRFWGLHGSLGGCGFCGSYRFKLSCPQARASILKKQIDELVTQHQSIKRMMKRKKKKREILMVPLRCPRCNGQLQPTKRKNLYKCKSCGTSV